MTELFWDIIDESAMLKLSGKLAQHLTPGCLLTLKGDLGAGKTLFCRGIMRQYGYQGKVKSPTFTLVEPYLIDGVAIYHFDLYRLNDPDELEYVGVDDYFNSESICLVEWPERGIGWLPAADLELDIRISGRTRRVYCSSETEKGLEICRQLGSGA